MKINIIGNGNVGWALAEVLKGKTLVEIFVRHDVPSSPSLKNLSQLDTNADLTIVCVNDDSINEVANFLPHQMRVLHTSGSVPMDVLRKFRNYGVLYPLQTISKERFIDLNKVPFLIEANNDEFTNYLSEFCAEYISKIIHYVNSEKRRRIHLSAVIANNFTTYLLEESAQIVKDQNFSESILRPLMEETIAKFFEMDYSKAQTGPAKRKDLKTIEAHLELLQKKEMAIVYELISKAILNKFNS